jgi:hypothetical protein
MIKFIVMDTRSYNNFLQAISMKNILFLFLTVSMGMHIYAMEIVLPADVVKTMRPHFTLQMLARFGQTNKFHAELLNLEKKENIKPHFSLIEKDYYLCTRALAYFAQRNNAKIFEYLYYFDSVLRNDNLEILERQKVISLNNKMQAYRIHYSTTEKIERGIAEQLREAIGQKKGSVVEIIIHNKKYNIFELFNDDNIEYAFESLCKLQLDEVDHLLHLFPPKNDTYKNKIVEYLSRFHGGDLLCYLLKNNYFIIDETFENKCTLLHYAVLSGNPRLFKFLLKNGADVHAVNEWDKQAVHYAHMCEERKKKSSYRIMPYIWQGTEFKEKLLKSMQEDYITQKLSWEIGQQEAAWLRRSCALYQEKEL